MDENGWIYEFLCCPHCGARTLMSKINKYGYFQFKCVTCGWKNGTIGE